MERFIKASGAAVPMLEDNVNTDEIAPIQLARKLQPDYRKMLFMRSRWNDDATPKPDYVLNRPQFENPAILVTGENFGCGSSREAAVWALMANGITCIIAPSFADQFRENCLQNGVLSVALPAPVFAAFARRVETANGAESFTADLESQTISGPGGGPIAFEISAADRLVLLEGLDDIGLTMRHVPAVKSWEADTTLAAPWYQRPRDSRHS